MADYSDVVNGDKGVDNDNVLGIIVNSTPLVDEIARNEELCMQQPKFECINQIKPGTKKSTCMRASVDMYPALKEILPSDYDYIVCEYNDLSSYAGEERFFAMFHVTRLVTSSHSTDANNEMDLEDTEHCFRNKSHDQQTTTHNSAVSAAIYTAAEAECWLRSFESVSKTTWRVDKTYPDRPKSQTKVIFKKDYHCQHNTRPTSHKERRIKCAHKKNTNCPAKLTLTINKFFKTKRNVETHSRPHNTLLVALRQAHNHLVISAETLSHRPVSAETCAEFTEMFMSGVTPSQALTLHHSKLRKQYGDKYQQISLDRSVCPDKQWCYRQYYKFSRRVPAGQAAVPSVVNNTNIAPTVTLPSTDERVAVAVTQLRRCVESWCSAVKRNPQLLLSVVERFNSHCSRLQEDELLDSLEAFCTTRRQTAVDEQHHADIDSNTSLVLSPPDGVAAASYFVTLPEPTVGGDSGPDWQSLLSRVQFVLPPELTLSSSDELTRPVTVKKLRLIRKKSPPLVQELVASSTDMFVNHINNSNVTNCVNTEATVNWQYFNTTVRGEDVVMGDESRGHGNVIDADNGRSVQFVAGEDGVKCFTVVDGTAWVTDQTLSSTGYEPHSGDGQQTEGDEQFTGYEQHSGDGQQTEGDEQFTGYEQDVNGGQQICSSDEQFTGYVVHNDITGGPDCTEAMSYDCNQVMDCGNQQVVSSPSAAAETEAAMGVVTVRPCDVTCCSADLLLNC